MWTWLDLPLSQCSHLTVESDWTQLDSTQLCSASRCPPDSRFLGGRNSA